MIGIYRIVNKINGKSYIGSSNNIKRRFYEHFAPCNSLNKNTVFVRAIKKYGKKSFMLDVLQELTDASLLPYYEKFWIEKLKPEYNMNEGGIGNCGRTVTEETKKLLSAASKKQWVEIPEEHKQEVLTRNLIGPRKGHPVSKETREKLRAANLGKKASEETRRKISESNKGKHSERSCNYKVVSAFNKDGSFFKTFESVKSAAVFAGVNPGNITAVLKKRQTHSGGYKWSYGSVETNRDECSGVGVNLSHVEARGIRKDEEIVQS